MTHFFGYKSHQTPVVVRLCSSSLLLLLLLHLSCSGGLIMKTKMLCQHYCTHACYSLHLCPPHKKQGMHIRQLIHLETLTLVSPSAHALWEKRGGRQRGTGWARERKWGDDESEKEHFDNPENCPDACGRPAINCFPNRWFVLDRHSAGASKHAAFPQLWIKWHLSIDPMGLNHWVQQTDTAIIISKQQSWEIYARLLDSEFSLLRMELIWVVSSLFHGGVRPVCKYASWELFHCFGDAKQNKTMSQKWLKACRELL